MHFGRGKKETNRWQQQFPRICWSFSREILSLNSFTTQWHFCTRNDSSDVIWCSRGAIYAVDSLRTSYLAHKRIFVLPLAALEIQKPLFHKVERNGKGEKRIRNSLNIFTLHVPLTKTKGLNMGLCSLSRICSGKRPLTSAWPTACPTACSIVSVSSRSKVCRSNTQKYCDVTATSIRLRMTDAQQMDASGVVVEGERVGARSTEEQSKAAMTKSHENGR